MPRIFSFTEINFVSLPQLIFICGEAKPSDRTDYFYSLTLSRGHLLRPYVTKKNDRCGCYDPRVCTSLRVVSTSIVCMGLTKDGGTHAGYRSYLHSLLSVCCNMPEALPWRTEQKCHQLLFHTISNRKRRFKTPCTSNSLELRGVVEDRSIASILRCCCLFVLYISKRRRKRRVQSKSKLVISYAVFIEASININPHHDAIIIIIRVCGGRNPDLFGSSLVFR
jgi:hypothetical protein